MAKSKNATEEKIKEFFGLIGIDEPFEYTEDEEAITITIDSQDPGMIIGHHGDTLDSLQLVLSLIIAKSSGEFKRVSLEVGDYKKNRADYLRNLAEQTKQRVLTEGREIYLPSLKPWERREVHMYLSEDEEVVSESVGEGKERTLVVKPK
jgi:spoIIIJ-associated protein